MPLAPRAGSPGSSRINGLACKNAAKATIEPQRLFPQSPKLIVEAEIGGGFLIDDAIGPFPSRAFALAVAHQQHREGRDHAPVP